MYLKKCLKISLLILQLFLLPNRLVLKETIRTHSEMNKSFANKIVDLLQEGDEHLEDMIAEYIAKSKKNPFNQGEVSDDFLNWKNKSTPKTKFLNHTLFFIKKSQTEKKSNMLLLKVKPR